MANFNKLSKKILRLVTRGLGRKIWREAAQMAREILYKRVKSGWGVVNDDEEGTKKKRLTKLSDSYKQFRRGKAAWFTNKATGQVFRTTNKKFTRKPVFGELGTANKSNLTLSGKMLDAIRVKPGQLGFQMFITGSRNKKVAKYVTDGRTEKPAIPARPFFALAASEQRQIRNFIRKKFIEEANKILSKEE